MTWNRVPTLTVHPHLSTVQRDQTLGNEQPKLRPCRGGHRRFHLLNSLKTRGNPSAAIPQTRIRHDDLGKMLVRFRIARSRGLTGCELMALPTRFHSTCSSLSRSARTVSASVHGRDPR